MADEQVDGTRQLRVAGQNFDLETLPSAELQALHARISQEANRIREQLSRFEVEYEMAAGVVPFARVEWRRRARFALKLKKEQMTVIHAEFARRKSLTPPLADFAFSAVYAVYGAQGLAKVQEVADALRKARVSCDRYAQAGSESSP